VSANVVVETYREYQARVRPAFHGGPTGEAWAAGLGVLKDALDTLSRQARRQRWLSLCAEDALAKHGAFRGWSRVSGESVGQYRARLLAWWSLAQWAGTAKGIVDAFALLGMTNVEVREAVSGILAGTLWGRYPGPKQQRHFAIVVRQPHPFGTTFSFKLGDGTKLGEKTLGFSGDASLITAMREIVRHMKPAHATCREIIIVLTGNITDGTGTTSDGDRVALGDSVAYFVP